MRKWILLSFFAAAAVHADDLLANKTITFASQNPGAAFDAVFNDLPGLFKNFQPVVDTSTKIISPLKVQGSNNHPILTMTIQKCVFVVCQTVQFDGEITQSTTQGQCLRNVQLQVNLSHSSDTLRDIYDRFNINFCLKAAPSGGQLQISALAHRAPQFQGGSVQQGVLSFLQTQIPAISSSLQKKLAAHQ